MYKINYFIGSNNDTKELELEKALSILSSYYEGMSVSEIVGYWQGVREKTAQVSIVCERVDYTTIKNVCKKLNNDLNQQAIMVEVLESNTLFISDR